MLEAEKEIDKASKSSFSSNEEIAEAMYYFFLINADIYNSADALKGNEKKIAEMADAFKQCAKYDREKVYLPILTERALGLENLLLEIANANFKSEDYSHYFKIMDYYILFGEMLDNNIGEVYIELAENAEKLELSQRSIIYWYKTIQSNYQKEEAYKELLHSLYGMKEYSQVDDFLKQAKQDFPNSKAFASVEIKRLIDKDLIFSALKIASEIIEKDSSNVEIIYLHGFLNSELNEHELALNSFLKAIDLDPEHFKSQFQIGLHYFKFANKEGHLNLAKSHLEKAYILNSADDMTRSLLHDVYVELGFVQEAIQLSAEGNE